MEFNSQKSLVVIKSWHAILTVTLWIVVTITQFVIVRAQTEQNTKDIERLREESINEKQFNEMRQDFQNRLERIERKIDEKIAIEQLH